MFPADNPFNQRVDRLPVARDSAALMARIGLGDPVHPDFGSGSTTARPIGIPYAIVSKHTRRVPVSFRYASESDGHRYPLPRRRDRGRRELDRRSPRDRRRPRLVPRLRAVRGLPPRRRPSLDRRLGRDLQPRSNRLRPARYTSADAAGLPILPGLARYDEVARGAIDHALRFTAPCTRARATCIPPATSPQRCSGPSLPPMGLRVRLKAKVSISRLPRQARVVAAGAEALRDDPGRQRLAVVHLRRARTGAGTTTRCTQLDRLTGRDFEVVDTRFAAPPRPRRRAMLSPRGGRTSRRRGSVRWRAVTSADQQRPRAAAFAAEHRFVLAAHAAALLGRHRAAARRLPTLCRAGFLIEQACSTGLPLTYRITRHGLTRSAASCARRRSTWAAYDHEVGAAWLWLAARTARSARCARCSASGGCVSRRLDRAVGPASRWRSGSAERPGRAAARLHYPDLLLVDSGGTAARGRARADLEGTRAPRADPRGLCRRPPLRRGAVRGREPAAGRVDPHVRPAAGHPPLVHVQRVRWAPDAPRRGLGEPAGGGSEASRPAGAGGRAGRPPRERSCDAAVRAAGAPPRRGRTGCCSCSRRWRWRRRRGRSPGWSRSGWRGAADRRRGWSAPARERARPAAPGRRRCSGSTPTAARSCSATGSCRLTR